METMLKYFNFSLHTQGLLLSRMHFSGRKEKNIQSNNLLY